MGPLFYESAPIRFKVFDSKSSIGSRFAYNLSHGPGLRTQSFLTIHQVCGCQPTKQGAKMRTLEASAAVLRHPRRRPEEARFE